MYYILNCRVSRFNEAVRRYIYFAVDIIDYNPLCANLLIAII